MLPEGPATLQADFDPLARQVVIRLDGALLLRRALPPIMHPWTAVDIPCHDAALRMLLVPRGLDLDIHLLVDGLSQEEGLSEGEILAHLPHPDDLPARLTPSFRRWSLARGRTLWIGRVIGLLCLSLLAAGVVRAMWAGLDAATLWSLWGGMMTGIAAALILLRFTHACEATALLARPHAAQRVPGHPHLVASLLPGRAPGDHFLWIGPAYEPEDASEPDWFTVVLKFPGVRPIHAEHVSEDVGALRELRDRFDDHDWSTIASAWRKAGCPLRPGRYPLPSG